MLGSPCSTCCPKQCDQLHLATAVEVDVSAFDYIHNCTNTFSVDAQAWAGSAISGTWSLSKISATASSSRWQTLFGGPVCGQFDYSLIVDLNTGGTAINVRLLGTQIAATESPSFLYTTISSVCSGGLNPAGSGRSGLTRIGACANLDVSQLPSVAFSSLLNEFGQSVGGFPTYKTLTFPTCVATDFGNPTFGITDIRVYL
jgi:hypothetical protein